MIEFNYLKLIETYRSNECVNEQEVKFKSDQVGSHKYQTAKNTKYIFFENSYRYMCNNIDFSMTVA